MADQDKQPEQPEPKVDAVKIVETDKYVEFKTLNGAVRRDMK